MNIVLDAPDMLGVRMSCHEEKGDEVGIAGIKPPSDGVAFFPIGE